MNWTEEQKQAIEQRGSSLLVSAAAGSGKTQVLTNRVVRYAAEGGSLDRLLVVTFTRLAASEMRERIGKLLSDAPFSSKEAMRRQKLLLYKAKISTIDSFFCEIVRDNFKTLGISPDFRMLDDTEYTFIRSEVLKELLEERYETFPDGFDELLRLFGGEGENEKVSEYINRLYIFLQSLPFPGEWADIQKSKYEDSETWLSEACGEILPDLKEYLGIYRSIIDESPFKDKDMEVLFEERDLLERSVAFLEQGRWDDFQKLVSSYVFRKSPNCSDDRTMQKYKTFRNLLKSYLSKPVFSMDRSVLESDLRQAKKGVFSFIDTTLEYISRVTAEMRRLNAYSFDAVAHLALSLTLKTNADGSKERTEYASKLADMFDEILIDEYQDVNDLQERFFDSISRNNCFAVGDVKQSIYMFRQANPGNFIEKEGLFPVIYLNRNFRSRAGILDFCNFVFGSLFSPRVGDMNYSSNEALYFGADYKPDEGSCVELHLLADDDDEETSETQARFCARRIKQLISSGLTVGKGDAVREADFSDFTVLMRDKKNLPVYERIFYEEGIPCYGTGGGTFLDAPETSTVFAFMKAIDNPYDDLSLFVSMFSPIGGFTADEIADMRLENKKASLYTNLKTAAEKNAHAFRFLDLFSRMRIIARNFPVHRLVREIYDQTGYPSYVSCMTLGYLKKERLMKFYAFCRSYGDSSSGSLYEFIRFTENASESNSVKASEGIPPGNFVKIMTIHASKGLEFPVVLLPQLNKQFNTEELKESLITDSEAGISTKIRDPELIYEQTTFMREIVSRKKRRKMMSENLRLLYVAFTRAEEKLILISGGRDYSEKLFSEKTLFCENGRAYPIRTVDTVSAEDLLLYCLTCHPKCGPLITPYSDVAEDARGEVDVYVNGTVPDSEDVRPADDTFEIPLTEEEIARRCAPAAKHPKVPAKLSVTELIKNRLADSESEQLIREQKRDSSQGLRRPRFMAENEELSGAEAGTAMHAFVSMADLSLPVEEETARLTEGRFISRKQAEVVLRNRQDIEYFVKSDLYARMMSAVSVRREEYFIARLPAKEYLPDADIKRETIVIQGAIDVLCEFEDHIMIIDYKTDRVGEEELRRRYGKQLEYYAYAAEQTFKKPVTELYLWSFYTSRAVKIESNGGTEK